MGIVADRRAALAVRVTSPDGHIQARSRAGRWQAIGFRYGSYRYYTDATLEPQLSALATSLAVGHDRGVCQIAEELGLNRRRDPAQAKDSMQRGYLEAVLAATATGSGPAGAVAFTVDGPLRWYCRIRPGTVKHWTEPELIDETLAAARAALAELDREVMRLKIEHFDLGLSTPGQSVKRPGSQVPLATRA